MSFINRSRLLNRVPQASRRRLSRDGEKAKAAIDLWDYQNRLMEWVISSDHADADTSTRTPPSPSWPTRYIPSRTPGTAKTPSGAFSGIKWVQRLEPQTDRQTPRLAELLAETYALFRRASASADAPADVSGWVLEVNKIFIVSGAQTPRPK